MYSGLAQAAGGGGGMVSGSCTSMSMMRPVEVSMGSPVRFSLPGEQQQQMMMMSGSGGYVEGHNPTTTMTMENRMITNQGDQFVEHGGMMAPTAQTQTQQPSMSVPGGAMHEIREQDLLMPPVRF